MAAVTRHRRRRAGAFAWARLQGSRDYVIGQVLEVIGGLLIP